MRKVRDGDQSLTLGWRDRDEGLHWIFSRGRDRDEGCTGFSVVGETKTSVALDFQSREIVTRVALDIQSWARPRRALHWIFSRARSRRGLHLISVTGARSRGQKSVFNTIQTPSDTP